MTGFRGLTSDTSPKLLTQPLVVALLAIGVFAGVTAVVMPLNQLTQHNAAATMNIDHEASEIMLGSIQNLPANAALASPQADGLTVNVIALAAPDGGQVPFYLRLLTDLGTALWAAALAFTAIVLALILSTINAGSPFHSRNSSRLVWIAIALLVGSIGSQSLNLLQAHLLSNYLNLGFPLKITPYYELPPILIAGLMLVLASAFRRGRQMQEDVEGLV